MNIHFLVKLVIRKRYSLVTSVGNEMKKIIWGQWLVTFSGRLLIQIGGEVPDFWHFPHRSCFYKYFAPDSILFHGNHALCLNLMECSSVLLLPLHEGVMKNLAFDGLVELAEYNYWCLEFCNFCENDKITLKSRTSAWPLGSKTKKTIRIFVCLTQT